MEATTVDAGATAVVAGFGIFMLVWVIVGLVVFVYWLWMLIDAIKRPEDQYQAAGNGSKILWILLILILGIIPAVIYHILIKNKVKAA